MKERKAEILNPKTDWVFKLMFSKGEEGNKALISFLNAFLKETYGTIRKADILNTELTRESPGGETYHLDLLVKTDKGLIVNIEMQQFWNSSVLRRNQLYLARIVAKNRTSCTIFSFKFRKRNLGIYSLCRPPWRYAKKEARYTFRY